MKKRINGKHKKNKNILTYFIIFLFIFYFISCLILMNRKYVFIERIFKTINCLTNSFVIENMYSTNDYESSFVSSKTKYLEEENKALKEALNLKSENSSILISTIINHNANTFFNKIEINKGKKDSVKYDSPVVNKEGLIGFIDKVGNTISEVNLITNVSDNNLIPILIESENGKLSGVISKYDIKEKCFLITDVVSKSTIKKGESVVLAGYDKIEEKGIYVGKVIEEKTSNYGLTKTVKMKSDVDFNDLLYAGVVMNE